MSGYNFSRSDFILSVGGQLLFLILIILVVSFGTDPITSFNADTVRQAVASMGLGNTKTGK